MILLAQGNQRAFVGGSGWIVLRLKIENLEYLLGSNHLGNFKEGVLKQPQNQTQGNFKAQ